jgi:hypothetical protein
MLKRGHLGGHCQRMSSMRISLGLAATMASTCQSPPLIVDVCQLASQNAPAAAPRLLVDNPCPLDGCTGNSPVVGGIYFDRLHYAGPDYQANPEGVRIVSILSPLAFGSVPMQLMLADENNQPSQDGDRLLGILADGSGHEVPSPELVGTRITVSAPDPMNSANLVPHVIVIDDVGRAPFWVGPKDNNGTPTTLMTTYTFKADPDSPPPDGKIPFLCSRPELDPDGTDGTKAVVFGGDLYDANTKKITTGAATENWLNIACFGSAVYKTHRVGYTQAAAARVNISTTIDQRQAMLNAWTANVCGNGQSFTVPGQQISLEESMHVFTGVPHYDEQPVTYEAIWGPGGAFCLDVPRRFQNDSQVCGEIKNMCQPPPCTDAMIAAWEQHGYVLTGNLPP